MMLTKSNRLIYIAMATALLAVVTYVNIVALMDFYNFVWVKEFPNPRVDELLLSALLLIVGGISPLVTLYAVVLYPLSNKGE